MKLGHIRHIHETGQKLQAGADDLFELDTTSKNILAYIARGGPQTVYELDKHKELSKSAINRRLKGDARLLSLLTENYLRLEGVVDFERIKGKEKKYYGLTLKGFLASLANVPCEENYMFKIFLRICQDHAEWSGIQGKLTDAQKQDVFEKIQAKVKIDLLIFFQYHKEHGLKLTRLKYPSLYFEQFWISSVPYWSKADPFSNVEPYQFSRDWRSLWKDRSQPNLICKIPTETTIVNVGRKTKRKLKGSTLFPSDPWPNTFSACWITKDEVAKWAPHPNWEFLQALLTEYKHVIKNLPDRWKPKRRTADPPWDAGILIFGQPAEELEKQWAHWSESLSSLTQEKTKHTPENGTKTNNHT